MQILVNPEGFYAHSVQAVEEDFEKISPLSPVPPEETPHSPSAKNCDQPIEVSPTNLEERIAVSQQIATPNPPMAPLEMSTATSNGSGASPSPDARSLVRETGCWFSFKKVLSKCFCCCFCLPKK